MIMYRREPVISFPSSLLLNSSGSRIGQTYSGKSLYVNHDILGTHAAVLGKTGSGKSNLLASLARNLVMRGDCAVVVLDPHGDLAKDLATTFEKCAVIIPARPVSVDGSDFSITMNPLHGSQSNPEFYSGWIRDTFASSGVFSQGTWGPRLEVIFSSLLGEVIRTREDANLMDLLELLLDGSRMRRFAGKVESAELSSFLRMAMADWRSWTQYVMSSVNKLMPLMTNRGIRNLVSGRTDSTDFNQLFSKPGKIIVPEIWKGNLSEESYGIVAILLILKIWSLRLESGLRNTPVYLIIDEAQLLPENIMDRILREGRKFGIHMIMATQYMGSTKRESRENILSNVGCFFAFSLPRMEAESLARNFFPDDVSQKLIPVLTSQEARHAVVWARNFHGTHGPVSFIPDHFQPPVPTVSFEKLRVRSVMGLGTRIYTSSQSGTIDLHEFLVQKISDFFSRHNLVMQSGLMVNGLAPDGIVDSGSMRYIIEVEVSDLINYGRILAKVRNYDGYRLIMVVPPGNASLLFHRLIRSAEEDLANGSSILINQLANISILEFSSKFLFYACGRLRTARFSHLESGSFATTLRELPLSHIRMYLFDRLRRGLKDVSRSEISKRFGPDNLKKAISSLLPDGKISISCLFGESR